MSEFIIKPAERVGAPPIIGLWGPSSCGKTMTALLIARGIVGQDGQIGVIDTENKRALLHADVARGKDGRQWLHLDLQPPFTPTRYTGACNALIGNGADIVIIDSGSHVWEGEGGVLEIASNTPGHGLQKWNKPKTDFKKMINALLRATVPVIWCLRSKEGFEQIREMVDGVMKKTVVNRGLVPIPGGDRTDGLIFEMTMSFLLSMDHKPAFYDPAAGYNSHPTIPPVKVPDALRDAVNPGEYLGVEFGEKIAHWIDEGGKFDKHEAELLQVARDVATLGTARLLQHMESLDDDDKKILRPHWKSELKPAAEANDPEPEAPEEESMFGGDSS